MKTFFLFVVLGVFVLVVVACASSDTESPTATPAPSTPVVPATMTHDPALSQTTTPTSDSEGGTTVTASIDPVPDSSSPSVEWRIAASDAVVRATLSSTTSTSLRFAVAEYLKGTGPSTITVTADPTLRNTDHDNREAVLFLDRGSAGSSGGSGTSGGEFVFTDSHSDDPGYTVDTLDPAWLPAEAGTGGGSGSSSGKVFITDSGTATGGSQEIVSLADLRTKIAWIEGGQNVAGYIDCIWSAIFNLRYLRDHQAYYGKPWAPIEFGASLDSGTGMGAVVGDYGDRRGAGYSRIWLTGGDAAYFNVMIVDDNEIASDGSYIRTATARPLPAGVYRFRDHEIPYKYMPCNYTPGTWKLDWVVTVTAPAGTLHEAFFDPTAAGTGDVSPTSFTVDGTDAEIMGLGWSDGKIRLSLNPYVSLAGYVLDFIELDGSVSLKLGVSEAEVDVEGGTLSWGVSERPWEEGDMLMLRIWEDGVREPPEPSPAVMPTPTP